MKFSFLLIILMIRAFLLNAQSSDITALRQLNQQWLNAIVNRDTSSLERILASDFILINFKGQKTTRQDNLMGLLSKEVKFTSVHADRVEARMIKEDMGMITCWSTFIFTSLGKQASARNCYQDIYVKRKGRWFAVSALVTML